MDQTGSYEIVKTIVTLAHNLGLQLVAEGVERSRSRGTCSKHWAVNMLKDIIILLPFLI